MQRNLLPPRLKSGVRSTALVGQKFPFGICWLSVRVRSGVGGPGPRKSRLVSNNTESRLPEKAVPSQSIQMSITSNETHHICTDRARHKQTDRQTHQWKEVRVGYCYTRRRRTKQELGKWFEQNSRFLHHLSIHPSLTREES